MKKYMKKKTKVTKWIKETIKRYGIELVLKEPFICLFLTQRKMREGEK